MWRRRCGGGKGVALESAGLEVEQHTYCLLGSIAVYIYKTETATSRV
jgi:hypothetical protein